MKDERFTTMTRFCKERALPYSAYLTDKATGMKFASCFDTKEQAQEWLENAKTTLSKGGNQ